MHPPDGILKLYISRAQPTRMNVRREACSSTNISKPMQYHNVVAPPPPELDPFEFEPVVFPALDLTLLDATFEVALLDATVEVALLDVTFDLLLLDEALDVFGLGYIVSVTDCSAW
jgi:hypothetical protein